jgi:hypothetical protein
VITITIRTQDGDEIVAGKFRTIEAIQHLQAAIETLRQRAAPVFDVSFGEQPQPLFAPTADEVSRFINR